MTKKHCVSAGYKLVKTSSSSDGAFKGEDASKPKDMASSLFISLSILISKSISTLLAVLCVYVLVINLQLFFHAENDENDVSVIEKQMFVFFFSQ